jgi:putative Holliday junction resolvase
LLALDYGRVHTGAALSDPTGTVVRPITDIDDAVSAAGLKQIAELVVGESVSKVIVGLPVTLAGAKGEQARETEEFIKELTRAVSVPVVPWDERFTSKMAETKARGSRVSSHSKAAAVLLEDYLGSEEYRNKQT